MKFEIGIRAGHFLSMRGGRADVENDIFVGVSAGKIAKVAPWSAEWQQASDLYIDASQHAVLPGFVNAHAHLAMNLFRGLEDDAPFHRWLFERILPLEGKMVDADFVRVGTDMALLECIRFGVTTVADMYFFSEVVADCIERSGLRGWVGHVWATNALPGDQILGSDRTRLFEQFYEKYGRHARVIPTLAPHAPYTCDDAVFAQVRKISERLGVPIQVHLSETKREVDDSFTQFGKSPVKRLSELGILNERTLCAHCVHLSEEDSLIMKESHASIAYNPDSNLKLSSGIAPITRYRQLGISVAFGTDGAASNNDLSLFGAMDVGTKLQKLASGDNTAMGAADALRCATWEGARALGLQHRIGSIEEGKEADIIAVDLQFPHMQPVHDVRSQLVYAAQGLEVDTVIASGKLLMRGKNILAMNQRHIFSEASIWREKIQQEMRTL